MKNIYKSLKTKGNAKLFSYSDSGFFNSRIITINGQNFGIFDIDNKYINYVYSNDNKNDSWFYLRQSEISDLKGKLSVSGLKITNTIKFSPDQPILVNSLEINGLPGFPNRMTTTIKKDNNEFLVNNANGENSVYINSISNFNIFNPDDFNINIPEGADNYLSITSIADPVVFANTIDLTGTKTSNGQYQQDSTSKNLMGYEVSDNSISYLKTSSISFSNSKYNLIIKKGYLKENASNILNLTCNEKVYYKEYDTSKNINCPGTIDSTTGIFIRKEGDKFVIYTPALKEEA